MSFLVIPNQDKEVNQVKTFILLSIFGAVTFLSVSCCCPLPQPEVTQDESECVTHGYHSLFVATFDRDKPCSTPAPSEPLQYGPPGASLNWSGAEGTIHVVDSATLGSRALKITRGGGEPTVVEAVVGNIDDVPNDAGIYDISFNAHGEVIPDYLIAGTRIEVRSAEDRLALRLILYDGSYHLQEGDSYVRLSGTYDPGMAHSVHIKLKLDTGRFSICVNDEVLVSNKVFLDDDFTTLHSLVFVACQEITEAFTMVFVVDEIRIIK